MAIKAKKLGSYIITIFCYAFLFFVYHLSLYSSDEEQSFENVLLFDLDSASPPPTRFRYHCNPLASFTGLHNLWQLSVGSFRFYLQLALTLWLSLFFGVRWLQVRPLPPPVRTTCVSCCFWWCSPSAGLQFGEEDVPGDPSTFVWTIIRYVHDT